MSDIRTNFDVERLVGDWLLVDGDLASDDGLYTAVIISLLTDALAPVDAQLPDGSNDRRGWWGDAYSDVPGDSTGSLLWLLDPSKQLASAVQAAKDYVAAALQWMNDDGVIDQVVTDAEIVQFEVLGWSVALYKGGKAVAKYRFDAFWQSVALGTQ